MVADILNLLFYFLLDLFTRLSALPDSILGSKADFVLSVRWKFWLGPNRSEVASVLFDKVAKKYLNDSLKAQKSAAILAAQLCQGVTYP